MVENIDIKVTVHKVKMTDDMQEDAVDYATLGCVRFSTKKEVRDFINEKFDKKYGPSWSIVVSGSDFSFSLNHKPSQYIYFSVGQFFILLFKDRE